MFDQAAVRQWLAILHGDAPGLVHICATGQWRGATFGTDELDDAAAYAAELDGQGREGIYARVTTLRGALPPKSRGSIADTLALPALWADIDIAGPGHAAPPVGAGDLPPDEDHARMIIAASGLPDPTLWVHSGGGLYPLWLLSTPHTVNGDLSDLADLSAGWQRVIGEAAADLGLYYGTGIGDLARVLRVPGTVNRKAGLARPCRVIGGDGTRYPLPRLYGALADALARWEQDDDEHANGAQRGAQQASGVASSLPAAGGRQSGIGTTPGDDFTARVDWERILEPHGWRLAYQRGSTRYWRRPGKDGPGVSATTNALGTDRLRVFSTSAHPFEATSYSKLAAFAALEHRGDLHAAAKALHEAGFGSSDWAAEQAAQQAATLRELVGERGGLAVAQYPPYDPNMRTVELPAGDVAADAAAVSDDLLAEVRYREEVAAEARRQRVRRDARAHLEAEDYERQWREPASTLTLAQELEIPDEPVTYRIDRLLPTGGNAILAAQFKAGKTTLCNDLVRSLADGQPFLGRFDVEAPDGRVALFNYEVGPGQYRRWLRELGISNPDRVCVLNVRGYRLPPTVAQVEAWIAKWLKDREVAFWVVDPFAAAFTGCGEENSNADVSAFLGALDVIKERAGVGELVLPVHTGRAEQEPGQERARGATRLDDWADARWLLTVDDQRRRFFRAAGRHVDVDEELVTLDPDTRRLTMGGWDRRGMKNRDLADALVAYVGEHPGLGVNEVVEGIGMGRTKVVGALKSAVAERRIVVREIGRGKRLHYLPGVLPGQEADL